jgi:hypothetical protein
MGHMIYREKFFNRSNEPAWHALGKNMLVDVDAKQALEIVGGAPPITFQPTYIQVGGELIEIPYRSIVRLPYGDDPDIVCGSVVSEDYGFIPHEKAIDIVNETMRKSDGGFVPVETMGFLRGGFHLFISYQLPQFEVAREEMRRYMLVDLPLTGGDVASVSNSFVRSVCANTVAAALAGAKEMYKIIHDNTAELRLRHWLRDMYGRFEMQSGAIREAMDILTTKRVNSEEMHYVLDKSYPIPSEPGKEAPPSVVEERMSGWEKDKKRIERYQAEAERLFLGDMKGHRSDLAGSAWYLYQAVGELENYRRGGGGEREVAQVAASLTFGDRRATIERAFAACVDICQN